MICDFCGKEIKNKKEAIIEHGYDFEGDDKTFYYHGACKIIISIKEVAKKFRFASKNTPQDIEENQEGNKI